MARYHIGGNGPSVCHASKRPCPLGGEDEHYSSMELAQEAYEKSMSSQLFSSNHWTPESVHDGLGFTEESENGVFKADSYEPSAKERELRVRLLSMLGDEDGGVPDENVRKFVELYRPTSSPYLDEYRNRLCALNFKPPKRVSVSDYMNGSLSEIGGGGTFSFSRGTVPQSGFCYSPYPEHSHVVDFEAGEKLYSVLSDFQKKHKDLLDKEDHYIGIWRSDDNKLYVDVSVVTEDAHEAREQCAVKDQIAFYDLTSEQCPNVDTSATSGQD